MESTGLISKTMPDWMLNLLKGFDWSKIHNGNLRRLMAVVGKYISDHEYLRTDDIEPIENCSDIPHNIMNLFNFVDYSIFDDETKKRNFRMYIQETIQSYMEV